MQKKNERSCRAQWKGSQNLANILGPQGNVTMIGASEYISRAQGASKSHLRPRNQVQLPEQQINKLWSPHKIWLTLPSLNSTATHPAPSPTHYNTPPPYAVSHYISHYRSTVLQSLTTQRSIPYGTSSSSTPTQSLHQPQTSRNTRTPNTLPYFSPHRHSTSIPLATP